jgi:hypothetical protein
MSEFRDPRDDDGGGGEVEDGGGESGGGRVVFRAGDGERGLDGGGANVGGSIDGEGVRVDEDINAVGAFEFLG